MTSLFRSRRDADELHDALSGRAAPDVARRHADLLRTVSLLTEHPTVTPRPEFSADLRERLMLAAQTELVAAPAVVRRPAAAPSATRRRVGTLAASLVIAGGTAGMAAAAQGALPGDPLYPIKRGGEQVLALVQPGSAGAQDLRSASERLDEAVALQQRGDDDAAVLRTLDDVRQLAQRGGSALLADYRAGGDETSVADVRDFAAGALPRLQELAEADPALEPSALQAVDLVASLDAQARELCPGCGGAPVSMPALEQSSAAASLASLLSVPAQQARLDARTLAGLDPAQVKALSEAAQSEADDLPVAGEPDLPGGGSWPVVDVAESPRGPVGSTLTTTTSGVVETLSSTVTEATGAVDGLVGDLRDTVGTVGKAVPRDEPVGGTVGGLTDTVDEALEGVSGVTGTLSGSNPLD